MGIDNRWFCFLHTSLSISSLITDCANTFIYSFTDGFALRNSSMLTWCCESFHFWYCFALSWAFAFIKFLEYSECLWDQKGLWQPLTSFLGRFCISFVLSISLSVISLYLLNNMASMTYSHILINMRWFGKILIEILVFSTFFTYLCNIANFSSLILEKFQSRLIFNCRGVRLATVKPLLFVCNLRWSTPLFKKIMRLQMFLKWDYRYGNHTRLQILGQLINSKIRP